MIPLVCMSRYVAAGSLSGRSLGVLESERLVRSEVEVGWHIPAVAIGWGSGEECIAVDFWLTVVEADGLVMAEQGIALVRFLAGSRDEVGASWRFLEASAGLRSRTRTCGLLSEARTSHDSGEGGKSESDEEQSHGMEFL